MRLAMLLAVPALLFSSTLAAAGEADEAQDLLPLLIEAANLGPDRGICIGSPEECGAARPTMTKDLMVNFEKNSAILTEDAKATMIEAAKALTDPRLPPGKILIEGYTDASGRDDYNQRLSELRAEAVVRFLAEQGVDPAKLIARGHGKSNPRAADPFDPINRRVEARWSRE